MELIVKKILEEQEKQFTKAFEHIKKTFESTKRSINLTRPGFLPDVALFLQFRF